MHRSPSAHGDLHVMCTVRIMKKILFQSLFRDLDLTTLKHCIFYFDKIEIPRISLPITWGDKNQNVRDLQSIPENVYEVIEFLGKEGVIDLVPIKDTPERKLPEVYNLILEGINIIGAERVYPPDSIEEICKFVGISRHDPERLKIADQVSIFLASVSIMPWSGREHVCCIDNEIIFDSVNLGIKQLINSSLMPCNINAIEINQIKTNILAQKLIALNLPSFKFQTFDDVLELRFKYNDNLRVLHNHLLDISRNLDGVPWDIDFSSKVDELIKKRLQPEIIDLRKNVKASPSKIANLIYDAGSVNLGLTFAFYSVFPNNLRDIMLGTTAKTLFDVLKSIHQDRSKILSNSPFNIFMQVK